MKFSRLGAQARRLGVTGCVLALGVAGCSSSPASRSGQAGSVPALTSASPTVPTEEADKAAVLKAYKDYERIQAKLDAAKPISVAEINSVSTNPWRAELAKIAKIDPKKYTISTGPVKVKVMDITITGTTATVMECSDTTKTTVMLMPAKFQLNSPEEPLYSRIKYVKISGKWFRSDYAEESISCEVGE
jgi:hypothetical protein